MTPESKLHRSAQEMLQPSNSETGQLQLPYFKDFCVHSHQLRLLLFPAPCMQDPTPSLAHAHISLTNGSESEPTQLSLTSQPVLRLPVLSCLSKTLSSQKAKNWRTNGWTRLLVLAPNIWRLVYCWTTAESVPDLGRVWEVHENGFSYQSCRMFVLQSQQKVKVGKIFS